MYAMCVLMGLKIHFFLKMIVTKVISGLSSAHTFIFCSDISVVAHRP